MKAQAIRRMGAASLDLCWTAAGAFDGFWEMRLGPWDMAAGGLVVLEAGGRISDLRGGPWRLDEPGVVATNGPIHAELLAALAEVRQSRAWTAD